MSQGRENTYPESRRHVGAGRSPRIETEGKKMLSDQQVGIHRTLIVSTP